MTGVYLAADIARSRIELARVIFDTDIQSSRKHMEKAFDLLREEPYLPDDFGISVAWSEAVGLYNSSVAAYREPGIALQRIPDSHYRPGDLQRGMREILSMVGVS